MKFIDLVGQVIGQRNLGRLEYYLNPMLKVSWGGPFNGQKFRERIFTDLIRSLPIKAIVETGTYRGSTTAFFAGTSLPVYTVELQPRFYSYSATRFRHEQNAVHLYDGDCRSFLGELSRDGSFPKSDVFFYLDAHWKRVDQPLREELELIFSRWERAVVMIDDFQVPNSDYSFDDYGDGVLLNLEHIRPVLSSFNIAAFFPAVGASEETGAKRGSVVLCREEEVVGVVEKMGSLVRSIDD